MDCKISDSGSRNSKRSKIENHEIPQNEQCRYLDLIIDKWRGVPGMLD